MLESSKPSLVVSRWLLATDLRHLWFANDRQPTTNDARRSRGLKEIS